VSLLRHANRRKANFFLDLTLRIIARGNQNSHSHVSKIGYSAVYEWSR